MSAGIGRESEFGTKEHLAGLTADQSRLVALIVLMVAVLLTYHRVPMFDFVAWDDQIHVYENPHFHEFRVQEIGYFWLHPYEGLYIPLSYTLFGLLSVLAHRPAQSQLLTNTGAHLDPHVFHTVSLCLHIANVWLVFFLLRRLTRADLPAILGSLLFGVHPLQVESVAWISEIRGLLAAFFSLVSIILYLYYATVGSKDNSSRYAFYAASLATFVCALLSKPSAAILGLTIAAFGIWGCGRPWKVSALDGLPYLIIGLIMLGVTGHMQEQPAGQVVSHWLRPFIAGDALTFYFWKFLAPLNLTIDYGRRPTSVLSHWWTYVEWCLPVAIGVMAFLLRRRAPYLAFGSIVSTAALLPVIGLVPFVFQDFSTVADRYVYFAMIGPALVTAFGLASVPQNKYSAAMAVVVVWISFLAVVSCYQTLVWRSTEPLYAHAVMMNPASAGAQNGLGKALEAQGQYGDAIGHYLRAVELDPSSAKYSTNLGLAYALSDENNDAIVSLTHAIALDPGYADAHCDLGVILLGTGDITNGVAQLRMSLTLAPTEFTAAECLGEYYANQRDYAMAIQIFSDGTKWTPDVELLWRDWGMALYASNRSGDAIRPLTEALQLDPSDKLAEELLNYIRERQKTTQ